MSRYATGFEHSDEDGDEMCANHDVNESWPLMVYIGNEGVAMYREDVRRLINYLSDIERKVPSRGT
jgi:hypothetical protein